MATTHDRYNPKIAKLYEHVPAEQIARLRAFRERYPYETIDIQGYPWRFIDTKHGENALFIPAGGTMSAEIGFQSIEYFAQRYRVISPDYPPINDLKTLFAGFAELFDRLGFERVYAMGGSYGGLMLQPFVRSHPERLSKIVLSVAFPPNPESGEQTARMMRWIKFLPTAVLRAVIRRSFDRLGRDAEDDPSVALTMALAREAVLYPVGRKDILAGLRRVADMTASFTYAPDDLDDWPGKMLILMGSEDPATPPETRDAMKVLYPHAEVKIFEGGGHAIAVSHQEEYFAAIDGFLES
jgi:pimeloyl-ACP methyl ester carboxylesterase